MPTIDTANCKEVVPQKVIDSIVEANKDYTKTIYVYDNDMVDEGQDPYSLTRFKVGDIVKDRSAMRDQNVKWKVTQICPATYGFMNIFLEGVDQPNRTSLAYDGDIDFA